MAANSTKTIQSHHNTFCFKLVIVSYKKKKDGINLIGIEPKDEKPFLVKNIVEGELKLADNGILIGKKLAEKLFVKVGDKLTVFALTNDQITFIRKSTKH